MGNPFDDRQTRIGKTGRSSEKRTASRLGGKLTPASGAATQKGDIAIPGFLIEAKSTTGNSMALQFEWLSKIAGEAPMVGKAPALSLTFVDAAGRPHDRGAWVCIPEYVFREVVQLIARDRFDQGLP